MRDIDDNITPFVAKPAPPRKPWPEKVVTAIEGLIEEVVAARLTAQTVEIAELRARVEKLERLTRHLDKPLQEVDS